MRSVRTWFQFKPNAFNKVTFKVLTPVCNVSNRVVYKYIIFREKIHLLLDRLVLQYTYTTLLLALHTDVKTLKVTLLNAFGLNRNQVRALLIFVCVFYIETLLLLMNGLATLYKWYKIHTVKPHADILVLGDFNIDLLKPHSYWNSTITLLGLTQLVKSPTRITQTSATLIDHMYTNNPDVITEVSVPDLSISDHCPISCSRSIKLPKFEPKTHSYISFRSFNFF